MTDEAIPAEDVHVTLEGNGVDLQALFQGGALTVMHGSRGRAADSPSLAESGRKKRRELIEQGVLRVEGDSVILTRDYQFDSPSGASMVMLGRHSNGWRDWRTSDGLLIDSLRTAPPDAREQGFRRRWYEAHAEAFARAPGAVANESLWQQRFVDSAADALSILAALGRDRDLVEFGRSMALWSAQPTTSGFNGFSGQMLLNQLVKRSEGHPELVDVLVDVLRAPGDDGEARARLKRLVDYIEEIRVGSHPAPGHAPFLVSYFWALHDPEVWPILWSKSAAFVEFVSGQTLPTSPIDRYEEFLRQHRQLEDDVQLFANVSAWWHDEKPVLLDAVLVDRCQFGLEESNSVESRRTNAGALVAVAQHIGTTLAEQVSSASGRSMQPMKPARTWRDDEPRADMWVDWRAHESGIGLRLWMNQNGVSIGLRPGWARNGWFDEVGPIVEAAKLDGFRMLAAPWSKFGEDVGHVGGVRGEFAFARWFEPAELAELDVPEVVTDVAVALQPLIDQLIQRTGTESSAADDDPLRPIVEQFNATIADTLADQEQRADRERFAEMLAPNRIALTDIAELRQIWNTGRYGGPGVMPGLNRTIRNADAAEYDRIIDAFRYLCWGDDSDEVRIDRLLEEPEYKVSGLGESVILKMLAICHPQKFIPVFPYSGPKGKRVMLAALGLDEPGGTRGEMQVASNDAIRARLEVFFPNDPWRMAQFLYWYIDGGFDQETADPDGDVLDELAEELLVDRSFLDDIVSLLEDKGQVIFYGPPGTGKTYLARRLAEALASDPTRRSLVQFHPSTSYEDFFEGYRPEDTDDGAMSYRLTRGPLALIAQRAAAAPGKRHLMVIDELNRANLPRVFGELLFLLEYRNESVRTLYRPEDAFELPSNLWFIGTMNTADRSIALVDAALRRRFHFIPFFPNHGPMEGLLERWLERAVEPLWVGELVAKVNDQLAKDLGGPHLQIGPSYFMKSGLDRDSVRRIWEYNIEPFIEDQFFGDPQKMDTYRFEQVLESYLHDDVGIDTLEALEAARSGEAIVPVDVDVDEGADIDGT